MSFPFSWPSMVFSEAMVKPRIAFRSYVIITIHCPYLGESKAGTSRSWSNVFRIYYKRLKWRPSMIPPHPCVEAWWFSCLPHVAIGEHIWEAAASTMCSICTEGSQRKLQVKSYRPQPPLGLFLQLFLQCAYFLVSVPTFTKWRDRTHFWGSVLFFMLGRMLVWISLN